MDTRGMRGVTVIELMVVICIAGILSGFAYIGTEMIHKEQVSSAARELLADIQRARMNAMTQGGKGYGIRFESSSSYVLFEFDDCNSDYSYDPSSCGGSREETNVIRRQLTSTVVLNKTKPLNLFNNYVLIFDQLGYPRQANWGMGIMTIVVRNESDNSIIKCITISMNRIRESSWNGAACI
jgi:prepilin-type N-terminal cleavage/methylation domain-containing protein